MAQERITFFIEDHIAEYANNEASRMGVNLGEYARLMFARGVLISEVRESAQQIGEGFRAQVRAALDQQVETFAQAVVERFVEIEREMKKGELQ